MKKTAIIQGPISAYTYQSISRFNSFGDYRIILSTWKGQPTVSGCEMLFLEDPGPGPIQNFNRQLIGASEALKDCKDGFLIKTRSDIIHFVDPYSLYSEIQVESSDYSLFKNKVFVSNIMTMNPIVPVWGEGHRNFNISDWIFCGNTEDIKIWYDLKDHGLEDIVDCCEQIFTLGNFLKTQMGSTMNPKDFNKSSEFFNFIKFLQQNFVVKNNQSSWSCICERYRDQPEGLPFYIQEV